MQDDLDYNPRLLPVISKPKGRLSEQEVRIAGITAQRLQTLRYLRDRCECGANLTVKGKGSVSSNLSLTKQDTYAVLSLLMERDAAFLIGLDIDVEDFTPAIQV